MFREGGMEEGKEREREEKEEKGERRKRENERHKQMSGDRRRWEMGLSLSSLLKRKQMALGKIKSQTL